MARVNPPAVVRITTGRTGNMGEYWEAKELGTIPRQIRLISRDGQFLVGSDRGRHYTVLAEDYQPIQKNKDY